MPASKKYTDADYYERKLEKIMERFGATDYDHNFDRHGAWVQFHFKDELYRFEHSVENANARGHQLSYGSDAFAQIVLSLEDLARMQERGIYDLGRWIAGLKFLPPVAELLPCFKTLGFTEQPALKEDVIERYRSLSKQYHPDNSETGNAEVFQSIKKASEQALALYH